MSVLFDFSLRNSDEKTKNVSFWEGGSGFGGRVFGASQARESRSRNRHAVQATEVCFGSEETWRDSLAMSYCGIDVNAEALCKEALCGVFCNPGISSSGIGLAMNRRRQGLASHRAQALALFLRALSVAMPVLAYICRYRLEMKMKASRALRLGVQRDRFQTDLML